ncbi:MAG: 1-acyl-sn-glycerol-3-phosphate acyltransferase, partial [Bacteroidales bacterium]|nr:1-acyl-sn-glycerol-3-phosphate acyltransferase [Bacteroidales bacterium]
FVGDVLMWLFTSWWDRRLVWLHRYSAFWAASIVALNPFWRTVVEGRQQADPNKTYVMLCNHQSLFDIVVLYAIRLHFKWVAKKELARVPFVGWNLYLNRYMLIDRGSFGGSKRMLLDGLAHLRMGSSLMVFPEGTRSATGRMGRFKDGAFNLAQQAQVALLPVVLDGTRNVFRGGHINYRQTFRIRVLPEVPYSAIAGRPVAEVAQELHALMLAEHKKLAPELYA